MRIVLTEHFQRDVRHLTSTERDRVFEAVLAIPRAVGDVHTHAGLGMRKVHKSGIWEVRIGLNLRIIFALADGFLTFVRLGTHDDVKRFLREL